MPRLPDDLVVCNCADCGCLLRARDQRTTSADAAAIPKVAGRIRERPYCQTCLSARPAAGRKRGT